VPVKAVVPFSERRHKAVTAPLQHQAVDLGLPESLTKDRWMHIINDCGVETI